MKQHMELRLLKRIISLSYLNLNANYFGQKYFSYPDSKWNIPSRKFPNLNIGYEKGFSSSVNDYNFDKILRDSLKVLVWETKAIFNII